MSFWDLSDGGNAAADAETEYEIASGGFEVIPDGSTVLALIDEAKWDKTQDGMLEFISLRWSVLQPAELANRKVFQKLWVTDTDPRAKKAETKRDKARRMLAAIDLNAGGKLTRKPGKPSDEDLAACLTNKPMAVKVMVWEMKGDQGDMMRGNWISAVGPKDKPVDVRAPNPAHAAASAPRSAPAAVPDDEVPF